MVALNEAEKMTIDRLVSTIAADPALNKAIATNSMRHSIFVTDQLPWGTAFAGPRPWTDTDDAYFSAYVETKYGIVNKRITVNALVIWSDMNAYDPFLKTVESIVWDGKCRLGTLLTKYLGAEDSEYTHVVEALPYFAVLARSYNMTAKFDLSLVLHGAQGLGKSTYARRFALADEFFTDDLSGIGNREAGEILLGKIAVEIAELSALKGKDLETVKAFLVRECDTFRPSYGRRAEDHYRRCVFVATTNGQQFLTDRTGNRRWLPVKCGVSVPATSLFSAEAAEDFSQAWAEALYLYRAGDYSLVLPDNLETVAEELREAAMVDDPIISCLHGILDPLPAGQRTCVNEVCDLVYGPSAVPHSRERYNEVRHALQTEFANEWILMKGKQRIGTRSPQQAYQKVGTEGNAPDTSDLQL